MNDIKQFEPLWGNWYAKEFIGEGGYGKVYRIEREEFGEVYTSALKYIKIPHSRSEVKSVMSEGFGEAETERYFKEFAVQLVKEVQLMARLKGNSHIVSYEDHKVVKARNKPEWHIFIRMELLTGLIDYISKKEITKRDVIKLGIDICKALEACQKHNIIHRDIKPENIFVSEEGNYKLGDFGIARQLEKTMAGLSKKGTYTYMAPEVYLGRKYGSSVDIYSLGLVMYRFLNNNRTPLLPPYPNKISGADMERSLSRRMSGETFDRPVNAGGRLGDIIMKACAYDPEERFGSPAEMRRDLEAVLYNEKETEAVHNRGGGNIRNDSVHYTDSSRNNRTKTDENKRRTEVKPHKEPEPQQVFYEDEPGFWDYYKKGLRDCLDFKGRMSRKDYWIFTGINFALKTLLVLILIFVCDAALDAFVIQAVVRITLTLYVILTFAGTSAGVRRLHDSDRRGFWAYFNCAVFAVLVIMLFQSIVSSAEADSILNLLSMLVLLYFAGVFCLFAFSLLKGSRGVNRFGKPVIYKKEGADMSYYTSSAYLKPYFYKRRKRIELRDDERVIISYKYIKVEKMYLIGSKISFTNYRMLVYDMSKWMTFIGNIFIAIADPKRVLLDISYDIIDRVEAYKYFRSKGITVYLNDGNFYKIAGFRDVNEIFEILRSGGIECTGDR
ncbi:MAG: protein kinase [Clostridiales bacterium]|nr:protein kinase [Clostridiales bacterium]